MIKSYTDDLLQDNQICLVIKVGSLNEIEIKKGIAHILEHVILLGIKDRFINCKGYVDFSEMVISFSANFSNNDEINHILQGLDIILDEQIVTSSRIIIAKIQIVLEKICGLRRVKKQKRILQKLFGSRLLEMPIGNIYKIFMATKREILKFYETSFLKENINFIIIGKDSKILQTKLEKYLKFTKVIVEKNEIYIELSENVKAQLIKDNILKIFTFICMEIYFYTVYKQDLHIEMLDIGLKQIYIVFVNKALSDDTILLQAIRRMKDIEIPENIFYDAKEVLKNYEGKIFDDHLIINAMIDSVMERGEAFYIQNINYKEINWSVLFNNAKSLIHEIFLTCVFKDE